MERQIAHFRWMCWCKRRAGEYLPHQRKCNLESSRSVRMVQSYLLRRPSKPALERRALPIVQFTKGEFISLDRQFPMRPSFLPASQMKRCAGRSASCAASGQMTESGIGIWWADGSFENLRQHLLKLSIHQLWQVMCGDFVRAAIFWSGTLAPLLRCGCSDARLPPLVLRLSLDLPFRRACLQPRGHD